ncbi:hypothetical protein G4X40_06355 [Rhodococcus sp. D2-41]|uniref:Uncharacterized protein n=1 Tax=Speluncibacter jeojiensis TaxID=2710754 RepID=A0A9X4LZK3_9ACTN|nr:hypothetical protein [Rhodococcus sp. D2-41]MDG3009767.1 hypothetical protein [Rhodococcus sp. D2-41]MDG3014516.1 hypothetical protein [Corynebacteriales bacterium D3-21]
MSTLTASEEARVLWAEVPWTLAARSLCTQALPTSAASPWGTGGELPTADCALEQDFVFHGPPPEAGDTLSAYTEVSAHPGGSPADRTLLTRFWDNDGRQVLEAWTNGADVSAFTSHHAQVTVVSEPAALGRPDAHIADVLASFAATRFPSEQLRRFRTRVRLLSAPEHTCTAYVVQRYVQDGETRVDVELTCTLPDGTVAAQAWASVAEDEALPGTRIG